MEYEKFSERVFNGGPIDWTYWAGLKKITPHQAAKLANRIDPIKWIGTEYALGAIPEETRINIAKLEQQIENKKATWNLQELIQLLDIDWPEGMLELVSIQNDDEINSKFLPRRGGYKERDDYAVKLVKIRPELLEMRSGKIKTELQKISNLFTSGYDSWWRHNPIFPKSKPGRNPKI
jgi:hypothetical protein